MSNHGKGNRQSNWLIEQNFYTYPSPIRGNNFINGSYDHNSNLDTWNTYGYAIFNNINNKSYKFGSIRIITKNNNNKFFTGPGYCKFEIFGKNQENLWILLDKFKVGKPDGSLDYYADITNVNDLIYLTRNFGNNKFYNSFLIKNTEISENFKFPIIEIEWDEYSTSLNIYSFPNSVLADGTGNGYENGKHLFVNQNSDLVITFFGGEELYSNDYKQLVSSITYKVGDNGDEILVPESDTAIQLANNTITLSKIIATSISNVHVIITLKSPDGTVSTSPLVAIIPSSDVGYTVDVPSVPYEVFEQAYDFLGFIPSGTDIIDIPSIGNNNASEVNAKLKAPADPQYMTKNGISILKHQAEHEVSYGSQYIRFPATTDGVPKTNSSFHMVYVWKQGPVNADIGGTDKHVHLNMTDNSVENINPVAYYNFNFFGTYKSSNKPFQGMDEGVQGQGRDHFGLTRFNEETMGYVKQVKIIENDVYILDYQRDSTGAVTTKLHRYSTATSQWSDESFSIGIQPFSGAVGRKIGVFSTQFHAQHHEAVQAPCCFMLNSETVSEELFLPQLKARWQIFAG